MQLEEKVMLLEAQLEKQLQSVSSDSQGQSEEITHVSAHSCLKAYLLKHNEIQKQNKATLVSHSTHFIWYIYFFITVLPLWTWNMVVKRWLCHLSSFCLFSVEECFIRIRKTAKCGPEGGTDAEGGAFTGWFPLKSKAFATGLHFFLLLLSTHNHVPNRRFDQRK